MLLLQTYINFTKYTNTPWKFR